WSSMQSKKPSQPHRTPWYSLKDESMQAPIRPTGRPSRCAIHRAVSWWRMAGWRGDSRSYTEIRKGGIHAGSWPCRRNGTSMKRRRPRRPLAGRISNAPIGVTVATGRPAARRHRRAGRLVWQAGGMPDTNGDLPLPPVERVRPGLWSIPVPIPNNPLRYVLVYGFESDRGLYLVDAGWNTDDA